MAEDEFNPIDMMPEVDYEKQQLMNDNAKMAGALTGAGFENPEEQNMIQAQLETDKILERIEHFLKGDQVKFGDDGAFFAEPTKNVLAKVRTDTKTGIVYYIQELKKPKKGTEPMKEVLVKIKNKDGQEIDVIEFDGQRIMDKLRTMKLQDDGYNYVCVFDEDKKPFNEYGVAELMRIMSMYVTKETFLSYYDEERINEILSDLGNALNNFLYCNYEKMGMDTKFKESKYTLIALNLLHVVESCYRRALDGAEQLSMRTRSIVTQNQGMGGYGGIPASSQGSKRWNPLKPKTW